MLRQETELAINIRKATTIGMTRSYYILIESMLISYRGDRSQAYATYTLILRIRLRHIQENTSEHALSTHTTTAVRSPSGLA